MVKFLLRPSTADDFSAIKALFHDWQINPFGLDWRRFVVAMNSDGSFSGCGQIKPHGDGSRELAFIAVIPEYRGQGVARMIIEHLLTLNPPPLYLMCRSSLENLYIRFGFRSLDFLEMPRFFGRMKGLSDLMLPLAQAEEHHSVMLLEEKNLNQENS